MFIFAITYDIIKLIVEENWKAGECMKYNVEEIRYLSSDGEHKIYAKIMSPVTKIKGIVQICHGMNGYISKYDEVAKRLVEYGYVVCGNTDLGHWDSVNSEDELGFFGEFNGYKYLISDIRKLTQIVKRKFPDKNYFLLAHSMGSFIGRCYVSKYGQDLAGAIFSGTAGPQPLIDSGIQFANMVIQRKGYRYRSRKLYEVMFQVANKEIKNPTSNYEWLTSKEDNYVSGKSKFLFTAAGLRDVMMLIKKCNTFSEIQKVPKDLPLYFFAGTEDPIGEYGDGVKRVIKLYQKAKIENVELKLYEGNRHECLNEKNSDEVMNDLIKWIEKNNKRRK